MASRQEEKEARRKARIEQEEAERKSAARRTRLQLVVGGVLAAGIAVAVVLGISAAGGKDEPPSAKTTPAGGSVKLPAQQTADLAVAAKDAGCRLENPPDEGRGHESKNFTAADYKQNPPTSGTHDPAVAQDGIYAPKSTPGLGHLVHTLEHGRIDVQYQPGTDPKLVKQLEAFVVENGPYHMVMYQNQTGMKDAVVATAWDHALKCPTPGPKLWDALRTFRDTYLDKGPEKIP